MTATVHPNTPAGRRAADKARLEAAVAAGELEPTKTRTKYACPKPDCGKCSVYTGDLGPDRCFDGYSSRFCAACGTLMVEEGPERFRIEFEQVSALDHPDLYDWRTERARQDIDHSAIPDEWWTRSRRQGTEHSIREQFKGLHQLIAEGEFIRSVKVQEVASDPVYRDITDTWATHAGARSPE